MSPRFEPIVGRYLNLELLGRPHRLYLEEAGQGIPLLCLHTAGSDGRQYRREVCREKEPELKSIPNAKADHEARCWGTQAGGWLVDTDWRHEVGDIRVLEEIKQEIAQLPIEAARAGGVDLPPPPAVR